MSIQDGVGVVIIHRDMVPLPPSKAFLKISREKGLIDITGAGDTIERELGTSEKPVRKGGGGGRGVMETSAEEAGIRKGYLFC